jgi:hypothetical protein
MDVAPLGVNARDAQILEARQFGIEEIARFYNVPLHMLKVNKAGSVSYASVEMFDIEFVMHTLRPKAVRNEQAIWRDLLSEPEQQDYYTEYLLDALMRGDSAARAAYYKSGIESQWLTPNEIREKRELSTPLLVETTSSRTCRRVAADAGPHAAGSARATAGRGERAADHARGRGARRPEGDRGGDTAARRNASDPDGWQKWCREFYDDHAGFIGHVLKMPSTSGAPVRRAAACRAGREGVAGRRPTGKRASCRSSRRWRWENRTCSQLSRMSALIQHVL